MSDIEKRDVVDVEKKEEKEDVAEEAREGSDLDVVPEESVAGPAPRAEAPPANGGPEPALNDGIAEEEENGIDAQLLGAAPEDEGEDVVDDLEDIVDNIEDSSDDEVVDLSEDSDREENIDRGEDSDGELEVLRDDYAHPPVPPPPPPRPQAQQAQELAILVAPLIIQMQALQQQVVALQNNLFLALMGVADPQNEAIRGLAANVLQQNPLFMQQFAGMVMGMQAAQGPQAAAQAEQAAPAAAGVQAAPAAAGAEAVPAAAEAQAVPDSAGDQPAPAAAEAQEAPADANADARPVVENAAANNVEVAVLDEEERDDLVEDTTDNDNNKIFDEEELLGEPVLKKARTD
ncbi:unnamed protein product [Caenorhabditis brenneri]